MQDDKFQYILAMKEVTLLFNSKSVSLSKKHMFGDFKIKTLQIPYLIYVEKIELPGYIYIIIE